MLTLFITPEFCKINDNGTIGGGNPIEAFKLIVTGGAKAVQIEDDALSLIIKYAKSLPAVLPYLPSPPNGDVVVVAPGEYAAGMLRNIRAEKPNWHSQCVVGVATCSKTKQHYFVARQAWIGCRLTLFPMMTTELMEQAWKKLKKQHSQEDVYVLRKHHHILFPTDEQVADGVAMDPLTFRYAIQFSSRTEYTLLHF